MCAGLEHCQELYISAFECQYSCHSPLHVLIIRVLHSVTIIESYTVISNLRICSLTEEVN